MASSLLQAGYIYAQPAILYFLGVYNFLFAFLTAPTLIFTDLALLRSKAFSRLWLGYSPATPSQALNDGPIPSLIATASGIVLEIGPGSGTKTGYFSSPNISVVYAAEPEPLLHESLRRAATDRAGLVEGRNFHVLLCGAEPEALNTALVGAGVTNNQGKAEEVFDTICSFNVLCSVDDVADTAKALYCLLKPGGRLIIGEHVVNRWRTPRGSLLSRGLQATFMMLGWSFFMGDCQLDRDTEGVLRRAGEWKEVDLDYDSEWGPLPFVYGVFVKGE